MTEELSRRLAAVMFTDVVGYTALMQDDEEAARVVRLHHRKALESAIAAHGGELVQYLGDGSLSTFPSTVRAVSAAVEVQQALRDDVPLRVGVHQGEIAFDEQGIYGDSVNVAARIMGMATAGSVLVSDRAQDELRNQRDFSTASLGHFDLKNVKHPMLVHAVRREGLHLPTREEILAHGGGSRGFSATPEVLHSFSATLSDSQCVAVLPLQNIGGDPENEFFSDGLTEDIIAHLSHVEELKVTSRTSVMRFKGTTDGLRDIAAALNVGTILEGSVRRAGNRLRVVVQLIDARSDQHLWAETFDRDLEDVFAIQSEIALNVAAALRATLGPGEEARTKRHSSDLEAYDAYLHGAFHWNKHTFDCYHLALRSFEQAIELDPAYARAHAGIASCYFWLGFLESMPPNEAYPKVKASASRALAIDDTIAEAHTYLGSALMTYEWDWAAAELEFKRGIELDPNSVVARQGYAVYLLNLGRTQEALDQTTAALAVDSLWVKGYQDLGFILTLEGKYAEAIDQFEKATELDPGFPTTHVCLGYALVHMRRFKEAIAAFKKSVEAAGGGPFFRASLAFALGFSGQREAAQTILDELIAQREETYVQAALIAWIHIGLGAYDAAFHWLQRAFEEHSALLISVPSFGFWDPIRSDERFTQLLDKMDLTARARLPGRELLLPGPK